MNNEISITGDFTTEKALEWKEKLNALAVNSDSLKIDLTEVTDADIVGVNALVSSHKVLSDKNGQLQIVLKKGSRMAEMLHLTKFTTIFKTTEI